MTTATEPALHLLGLKISNFMQIQALRIDARGKHVVISADNGRGKTSAIKAIMAALEGVSMKAEPIRHGERAAEVAMELGDRSTGQVHFRLTQRITPSGAELILRAADGEKLRRPTDIIDSWKSRYMLNPVKFATSPDRERIEYALRASGVAAPVQQVRSITGEDFPARADESAAAYLERLAGDGGILYERRKACGKEADAKNKAWQQQKQALDGLPAVFGAELSATELLAQIEELNAQREKKRAADAEVQHAMLDLEDAGQQLQILEQNKKARLERIVTYKRQIEELQKSIAQETAEVATLDERMRKGNTVTLDLAAKLGVAREAAGKIKDPSAEITGLQAKVKTVEEGNRKRAAWRAAQDRLEALKGEHEVARAAHEKAEAAVKEIRALQATLLEGIDLGVPGITIEDGKFRVDGTLFDQCSRAQQAALCFGLAALEDPRLKLVLMDDAERLSTGMRQAFLEHATAKGYECVLTCVSDDQEPTVQIVE